MSAEQKFDLSGELVEGRYLIREALGRGGMATVFLAEDQKLDRLVVVKVPHPWFLMMEGFRERFQAEIRSLTRVDHPHIVKVLDVGTTRELPCAVMQYLKGGCLKNRMQGPMSSPQIAQWLPQIAGALDFVHEQDVVHRDVKPGNILFDDQGNVFLADFGIAKALGSEDTGLTQTGASPGTPGYMAPEIGTDPKVGPEYDQYSLGVVVYQALTGQLPHSGETPIAMMLDKMNRPATPVLELVPGAVPDNCSQSVMRALATRPEDRFRNCNDFATAFCCDTPPPVGGPVVSNIPATMTHVPTPVPTSASIEPELSEKEGAPTGRRSFGLIGGLVIALVAAALLYWSQQKGTSPSPVLTLELPQDEDRVTDKPLVVRGRLLHGVSSVEVIVTELVEDGGPETGYEVSQVQTMLSDGTFAWEVPLTKKEARYKVLVKTEDAATQERWVEVGTGPRQSAPPQRVGDMPVPLSESWVSFKLSFDETTIVLDSAGLVVTTLTDGEGEVRLALPKTLGSQPEKVVFELFPQDSRGHSGAAFKLTVEAYDAEALVLELRANRPDQDKEWGSWSYERKLEKVKEWEAKVAEWNRLLAWDLRPTEESDWNEVKERLAAPRVPEGYLAIGEELGANQWCKRIEDPRTKIRFVLVEPGRGHTSPAAAYYLAETEVTVAQWTRYVEVTHVKTRAEKGTNGFSFGHRFVDGGVEFVINSHANWRHPFPVWPFFEPNPHHPVTLICFDEAQQFCVKYGYRLPTELEWEFAARAGRDGKFWWGNHAGDGTGNENLADSTPIPLPGSGPHHWDPRLGARDGFPFLAPVASFSANPWGFFDMLGNATEFCADFFDHTRKSQTLRGGTFFDDPAKCVISKRKGTSSELAFCSVGFRVALDLGRTEGH